MRLRAATITTLLAATTAFPVAAQPPQGVYDALANLTDQPASRISFTFDHSTLAQAQGLFGTGAASSLAAVTVNTYRYPQIAFYTPKPSPPSSPTSTPPAGSTSSIPTPAPRRMPSLTAPSPISGSTSKAPKSATSPSCSAAPAP